MSDLASFGRIIFVVGLIITLLGLGLMLGARFFPWLGRLPGDIQVQGQNFSCFFPIVSSIVLSIILTIVINVILRFLNP